jgi:hypothetical protein
MPATLEQLQVAIAHILSVHGPMKGVDLCLKVMAHLHPALFEREEYELVLQNMVAAGDILEIEYILPSMDYRIKSIFFPKGTRFPLDESRQAIHMIPIE